MKTIYLLIYLSICCLHVFGQTNTDSKYIKTSKNTYYIHYYSELVSISNDFDPLNGKMNPFSWQDWYRFDTKEVIGLSQYIEPYIGPYLKNYQLRKNDVFEARIWIDLQGNIIYCVFKYPSKIKIPLTVIEQIETSLKANGKVKITPIGTPRNDMYYVETCVFVHLEQLQTRLYRPT